MVLREDAIERPDGVQGVYAVVDKPRGALVIPWDGSHVHLVGQYRYTISRDSWEFVQGSVHDGVEHPPEHVARTELQEETGLTAQTLRPLGSFTFAVGVASQWCDAFFATGLQQGDARPEPEEVGLRTRAVTIDQLERELRDGTIFDAATLAAWQLLMLDPELRAELGR
jgi:8-oxo-dGDP phosphatase